MFAYQVLLDSIKHAAASKVILLQSLFHITALQSDPGDIQIHIQSDPYIHWRQVAHHAASPLTSRIFCVHA